MKHARPVSRLVKSAARALTMLALTAWTSPSMAENHVREVYFRTGLVTGLFQGKSVTAGSFTSDVSLQIEVLEFSSPRTATAMRALLSNESGIGQARYFGAGGGQRYFFSDALLENSQESGNFVTIRPSWTFYAGWDVNMAQFLVVPLSDTVGAYATMVDIGATAGLRRVISEQYSADAMIGYSFGYSISSAMSVTASIIRVLFGIGYTF